MINKKVIILVKTLIFFIFLIVVLCACKKEKFEFDGYLLDQGQQPIQNYSISAIDDNGFLQECITSSTGYFKFKFQTKESSSLSIVANTDTNFVSNSYIVPNNVGHLGYIYLERKYLYEIDGFIIQENTNMPCRNIAVWLGQWQNTINGHDYFTPHCPSITDTSGYFRIKYYCVLKAMAIDKVYSYNKNTILPGVTHLGNIYGYYCSTCN